MPLLNCTAIVMQRCCMGAASPFNSHCRSVVTAYGRNKGEHRKLFLQTFPRAPFYEQKYSRSSTGRAPRSKSDGPSPRDGSVLRTRSKLPSRDRASPNYQLSESSSLVPSLLGCFPNRHIVIRRVEFRSISAPCAVL